MWKRLNFCFEFAQNVMFRRFRSQKMSVSDFPNSVRSDLIIVDFMGTCSRLQFHFFIWVANGGVSGSAMKTAVEIIASAMSLSLPIVWPTALTRRNGRGLQHN